MRTEKPSSIRVLVPSIAVVLLIGLLMFTGCASTGAPKGWLPEVEDAPLHPYGGWIEVATRGDSRATYRGELLAVDQDSLYILTVGPQSGVMVISWVQAHKIRLAGYEIHRGSLAGWTVMGSVSTLSHGFGLILSLPIWIGVGSASTAAYSHAPIIKDSDATLPEIRKYARFPQGMPPHLDRASLTSFPGIKRYGRISKESQPPGGPF